MPELSRFLGIAVKLARFDNEQRRKPHAHVYYDEHEASIAIDGELLADRCRSSR